MNTPTKDRTTLPQANEDTALVPAVSDGTNAGKPRKMTFPRLAAAQQRVNPFEMTTERVLLVEYSGVDAANRASETADSSLIAGESFDDGYYLFEIVYHYIVPERKDYSILVSEPTFNATDANTHILWHTNPTPINVSLWRSGASTFRVYGYNAHADVMSDSPQTSNLFLKAIYGHRLNLHRISERTN